MTVPLYELEDHTWPAASSKRFKERFSVSFKGKDIRDEYRESVLTLLWRGETEKAISVAENAEPLKIKDYKRLKEAIGYLNKKGGFIPDRALRKTLDLRICGNRGEKANDSVVYSG
jgi:hypothetical protein